MRITGSRSSIVAASRGLAVPSTAGGSAVRLQCYAGQAATAPTTTVRFSLILHRQRHFARRSAAASNESGDDEGARVVGGDAQLEDDEQGFGEKDQSESSADHVLPQSSQGTRNGAAPKHTETTFDGISTRAFHSRVAQKLLASLDPNIVEIKPDGTVYLPEINYRRILNQAFGPGGWALMPRGPAVKSDRYWTREWALFCHGRFVAQASGESELLTGHMGPATALEGVKSQALVRCCKDIGIASDLWDNSYITKWKSKHAVSVICENVKTGQRKTLLRRKDRPAIGYPWKEVSVLNAVATPSASAAGSAPDAKTKDSRKPASASSASSASSAPVASSPAATPTSEPFDMDRELPGELKRFKGKKWSEVTSTEEGRRYLRYIAKNLSGQVRELCRRALDTHEANAGDKTSSSEAAL